VVLVVRDAIDEQLDAFKAVLDEARHSMQVTGTKITDGKVMRAKTRRCANRAAQALRLAAPALRTSQSALGA